jgi:hypothetical protein
VNNEKENVEEKETKGREEYKRGRSKRKKKNKCEVQMTTLGMKNTELDVIVTRRSMREE